MLCMNAGMTTFPQVFIDGGVIGGYDARVNHAAGLSLRGETQNELPTSDVPKEGDFGPVPGVSALGILLTGVLVASGWVTTNSGSRFHDRGVDLAAAVFGHRASRIPPSCQCCSTIRR